MHDPSMKDQLGWSQSCVDQTPLRSIMPSISVGFTIASKYQNNQKIYSPIFLPSITTTAARYPLHYSKHPIWNRHFSPPSSVILPCQHLSCQVSTPRGETPGAPSRARRLRARARSALSAVGAVGVVVAGAAGSGAGAPKAGATAGGGGAENRSETWRSWQVNYQLLMVNNGIVNGYN